MSDVLIFDHRRPVTAGISIAANNEFPGPTYNSANQNNRRGQIRFKMSFITQFAGCPWTFTCSKCKLPSQFTNEIPCTNSTKIMYGRKNCALTVRSLCRGSRVPPLRKSAALHRPAIPLRSGQLRCPPRHRLYATAEEKPDLLPGETHQRHPAARVYCRDNVHNYLRNVHLMITRKTYLQHHHNNFLTQSPSTCGFIRNGSRAGE